MKLITRAAVIFSAFSALFVPTLAQAWSVSLIFGSGYSSSCTTDICNVASNIIYLINGVLVPVIFAVAFLVFLYGVASAYILSNGDPERVKSGHTLILWGIIGFVVMVSLWGLVNVVGNTFGLDGEFAPSTPTSYK